jgi:mono/diheme cytochrome c family protein
MKRIMAPLLIVLLSAAAGRAPAQDIDAYLRGKAIAEQVCSECHAIRKDQVRSPNGLAPTFEEVATTPGMTALALTAALRTSHPVMPNLILSDDQLRGIIAYITSLRLGVR